MGLSAFLVQLLNGLAGASSLFLVAAGLSLIFGVTRIVNFAHGSFYMLGLYVAWSLVDHLGTGAWFWPSLLIAAMLVGLLGAAVELLVLRRIYRAPELFQLLATFALVLILKDAALWWWGPEDLLGPRAPGLSGAVLVLGRLFPSYDLFLIAVGPLVLALIWLLLHRTRWGTLVRAATQDRAMLSALGVNQAWLFTSVFALGSMLAALGGALQLPREPANLGLDMATIGDAFVVVVVGGMGSLAGAYLAALLIGVVKALCVGLGTVMLFGQEVSFSSLTLAVEFLVMAVVLVVRPWGLLGRPQSLTRSAGMAEPPLRRGGSTQLWASALFVAALVLLPQLTRASPYTTILAIDLLTAALFATSLHVLMGPGGMVSFGHAAYFGLGAYGAALLVRDSGWTMEASLLGGPLVAAVGAMVFGWFCVRLSGVYLAMLSLAFAQIAWSIVHQWDGLTGGSNGLTGVWPADWLQDKQAYYHLTLALVVLAVWWSRRLVFAPFGMALRAARDSALRAEAIGIHVKRVQWLAFVVAGLMAGLAGALFAFSKGSIAPDSLGISRSIDALVMVLLGGVQTLAGPLVGAVGFTWLQDQVARSTEFWRALLGAIILLLVLAFPRGIAGFAGQLVGMLRRRGVGLMVLLAVTDLHKAFGGNRAVDGVDFSLSKGELLALIGPNGAGKSTVFNMLSGQLRADRGSVRFAGRELLGRAPRAICRLGVGRTFQIAETFGSLSVCENVQMALIAADRRVFGFWRRADRHRQADALQLLGQVGMAGQAQQTCADLSYGDVKRVELAMAMAAAPGLLLMDEPTAGMAPAERLELMALTRRWVDQTGAAVLFTEHSMDVVFAFADRIVVLAEGRVIADATPQAVRHDTRVQQVYFGSGSSFEAAAPTGAGA